MRKIYRKFLSEQEAEILKSLVVDQSCIILNQKNIVVDKILNRLSKDFEFEIKPASYYRLEKTRKEGHGWHKDTGDSNHMMWCQVGCSILLESESDAGKTFYDIDGEIIEVERDKLDLIAHTSDVLHKVDPPEGHRLVFLIFI